MASDKNVPIKPECIEQQVLKIRDLIVILDSDLDSLYGTSTKALNQAVKRNIGRFPIDFMLRLTEEEKQEVVTNCDHLTKLKFSRTLPYAFTEHRALMLASLLNSEIAINMSIELVRAFVKMRKILQHHSELSKRLDKIDTILAQHGKNFKTVFDAIKQLMLSDKVHKNPIGFCRDGE